MKEHVNKGETMMEERVRKVDGDVVDKQTVECGAVHGV
jgi:general secretion pathway protein E